MKPYQLDHFRCGLVLEMRNAPAARARMREGLDEPRRYQTGDLNAYDTLYRSVLPEYPNLSTSELSARFGVIGALCFAVSLVQ